MNSNSKGGPIARSEAELARQFADEYAGKVRCRFDSGDRWHWERANAGEWLPVDFNRLLAVVADFGAARFHATGPDGTPYPAPDRGGRAATARGVLNLAAWRLAADDDGGGPLHRAVFNGDTEALRVLLEAGADVNAQDQGGNTPLHSAARNGRVAAIRMLAEAGADVNAQDQDGDTPLHHAARNGDTEALRVLLEAGADVNVVGAGGWHGYTPLDVAARNGEVAAIRTLVEVGKVVRVSHDFWDSYSMRNMDREAGELLYEARRSGRVKSRRRDAD